jgi:hypothetical protein
LKNIIWFGGVTTNGVCAKEFDLRILLCADQADGAREGVQL